MALNVRFEDISPFVRAAIICSLDGPTLPTVAYDHRIFYVLNGSGTVEIADTSITLNPGAPRTVSVANHKSDHSGSGDPIRIR